MPSLKLVKQINAITNNNAKTLGQIYKEQSDWLMEETWEHNIQSKVCYIYDYFHDDQKDKKDHMTYNNTTKTRIDAKFMIKSYQSINKDQVDYYIQFKPSQSIEFSENDDLYYFETGYRKCYGTEFPIGCYIDIPDDKNIYHKWLICLKEIGNQFVKYLILPVNYQLMWIEKNGQERIKRKMWGVVLSQNSYNSGIYSYDKTTKMENQEKIWLPLNSITENIWYTSDDTVNMRVLIGAPTKHPLAWIISKVENAFPIGIQKLTFYQSEFNPRTDYVNLETGEMFADYYSSNIEPTEYEINNNINIHQIQAKIISSTSSIKVGGSYKTLSLKMSDINNEDITNNYLNYSFKWKCYIEDNDLTNQVIWLSGKDFNQIKIKFPDDRKYLGKLLDVKCTLSDMNNNVIIEVTENYDLVI